MSSDAAGSSPCYKNQITIYRLMARKGLSNDVATAPFYINQITIWSSVANTLYYYLFGAAQICSTVIG